MKTLLAVLVLFSALTIFAVAGCESEDNRPSGRQRTPATDTYRQTRAANKDAAERLCASIHGVPKWYRPDRDYHNCVDRLT